MNDSLIDVWKVSDGHVAYYTRHKDDAETERNECEDIVITQEKMHLEIYESLPEFDGF